MAKKILLLDVSHLFFRAFYAFPRNLTDREKRPINAVFGVAQMLMSAIERENPHFIFGGKDLAKKTFRSEKLESYKGQRPELDDDLRQQIPRIYEMLNAWGVPVFSEEGYEADDILASLAEMYRGNPEYIIEILTGDADAFQLIGDNVFVLKPSKGDHERFDTDVLFTKKNLYPAEIPDFKGMAGDSSDNLKGVEGIGEKGATDLIREFGSLEQIYKALQEEKIKGAKAKKLMTGKEDAFFTRDLVLLYRDIHFPNFELENGRMNNFSIEGACQFFESIGSNSLQNRIKNVFGNNEEEKAVEKNIVEKNSERDSSQSSLF